MKMQRKGERSHSSLKRREGRETTDRQIAACHVMYHVAIGQQTSHSVKEGSNGLRSWASLKVTTAYRHVYEDGVIRRTKEGLSEIVRKYQKQEDGFDYKFSGYTWGELHGLLMRVVLDDGGSKVRNKSPYLNPQTRRAPSTGKRSRNLLTLMFV
jgi:hypothetical protein